MAQKKKNKRRRRQFQQKVILSVLLVIIIGLIGVLGYQMQKNEKKQTDGNASASSSVSSSSLAGDSSEPISDSSQEEEITPTPEPVQQISSDGLNSQHALLVRESDLAEMMNLGGDERIYPASMTKIMTALLTIENLPDLNETITVPEDIFEELTAQDARNGKADQAKQGETAQLTEDESTGTTEQQTEETTGDADGTRAVQDQADDVENSLEQVPEMEAACEEEAVGNPEADAETAQNTPEESDGNTERQDAQAVNGTAADQNGETGSGETAANEETSAASGTVDSAENQETAVETAGAAQDLMFSEATIMELPVTGTVLIPYNMENTVYFPTLDLYQCNPGVVFSAAEGTPVLAAADGEVVSVENDARTGLTVTMNLGNGYEAIYGQLTDVSLESGQKVQKAARIGAVAAPTKYYVKEGSNLFFEMKKDGKAIDPMAYLPAISE